MKRPKLKLYTDSAGLWRWSLVAANGRTLADSGEGYASRSNVGRAFLATLKAAKAVQTLTPKQIAEILQSRAAGLSRNVEANNALLTRMKALQRARQFEKDIVELNRLKPASGQRRQSSKG